MGVVGTDASDATGADADAGERLVPANQLPIPVGAPLPIPGAEPPGAVEAVVVAAAAAAAVAALIAVEAAAAAVLPAGPGVKVSCTLAVDDPGVMLTAAEVASGYWASMAACTLGTSAGVSGFANAT